VRQNRTRGNLLKDFVLTLTLAHPMGEGTASG
jgi:hypothetical protein